MNIGVQRASRGILSTSRHKLWRTPNALPKEPCRFRCGDFVSTHFADLLQFLVQYGRAQWSRQHLRLSGDGTLDSRLPAISCQCTDQLPVDREWWRDSAGEIGNH